MFNLLTQVGQELTGYSRRPTSITHTNSNQEAVATDVGPDFYDSSDDNEDDLQKHLKSPKFTGVTKPKEKHVTFDKSIDDQLLRICMKFHKFFQTI